MDGSGTARFGPFGDLFAEGCKARQMAGAVFDCTIRDSVDIAVLGFQVFSRGYHPEATAMTEHGETAIPIVVGGVEVRPGDIVVGDDDGVVVIPSDGAAEVLHKAAAVVAREAAIRTRWSESSGRFRPAPRSLSQVGVGICSLNGKGTTT